jgi:IS5 family transposase
VRPIARGKAGTPTEFGAKLSLSLVNGFSRVEHISWNNYNESTLLVDHVEKFRERYGYYPASVEADKIYRTRENRTYCSSRGIRLSGPSLGRPRDGAPKEKENASERNPIEGKFGESKRKYGLGRIMAKLECTSMSTIGIIVLVMNLQKRLRLLLAHIFKWLFVSNFRLCDAFF